MSDLVVTVVENSPTVTVSDATVAVDIVESVTELTVSNVGLQGPKGDSYQPGDPIYALVRNQTGSTMSKGQVVYTSGANGDHVQVSLARADADATSARTMGFISADIAHGADGYVVTSGYLTGLDTDGETVGSIVYLSGTVAGGWTTTKPVAPIHMVYVGVITRVNANNGSIYVHPQNGYELSEIHDVLLTSPTNNQVLTYESSTGLWKNKDNAADGVTSVVFDAPLTGGTVTSSGTVGLDQTALVIAESQVTNLTTDLAAKAALTADQTFTGTNTFVSAASGASSVVAKQVSGASVNILDVQNSGGTSVGGFGNTGNLKVRTATEFSSALSVAAASSTQIGAVVRAAASQTANLTEWQNSAGTAKAFINSSGDLQAPAIVAAYSIISISGGATVVPITARAAASQTANLQEWQNSSTTVLARISSAGAVVASGVGVFGAQSNTPNSQLFVLNNTAANPAAVIKGAASQTGNLTEWQTNDGIIVARVLAGGQLRLGTSITGTALSVNNDVFGASVVGALIRGAVSQTADLQQWQNSAGTVQAKMNAYGALTLGSVSISAVLGLTTGSATNVGAIIRGAASQTANLTEWQGSGGGIITFVDQYGRFRVGTTNTGAYTLNVKPLSTAEVAILAQANSAATTGDLMQYQANTNTVLGGRNANAQIFTGSTGALTTAVGGATTAASGTGTTATLTTTSNHNLAVGDRITVAGVTPTGYNGTFIVTAAATNSVSYASSATGSQTVAGTVSVDAQASITARSAATAGLIVKLAASQNGNAFAVQNSSGSTLARITETGQIMTQTNYWDSRMQGISASIALQAAAASNVVGIFRGAASQSASLQEWQNSAGTVLAYVTGSGVARFEQVQIASGYASLAYSSSGGSLRLVKKTAAQTNIGANIGDIYFRDGTNAGTLKLVVRAGAAGAETTILDNIPQ